MSKTYSQSSKFHSLDNDPYSYANVVKNSCVPTQVTSSTQTEFLDNDSTNNLLDSTPTLTNQQSPMEDGTSAPQVNCVAKSSDKDGIPRAPRRTKATSSKDGIETQFSAPYNPTQHFSQDGSSRVPQGNSSFASESKSNQIAALLVVLIENLQSLVTLMSINDDRSESLESVQVHRPKSRGSSIRNLYNSVLTKIGK